MDDEQERSTPLDYVIGQSLDQFSLNELEDILNKLDAEKTRVEAAIQKKNAAQAAAQALFGKPAS